MKKFFLFICLIIFTLSLSAQKPKLKWKRVAMNASRTGVKYAAKDSVKEDMGYIIDSVYYAPNSKKFTSPTVVRTARLMINAQKGIALSKTPLGYSAQEMKKDYPESPLSNWFVDNLMKIASQRSKEKIDVGIGNFGGIRCDMPKGVIYQGDIMAMFPFKNSVAIVKLQGKDLRKIFEYMAKAGFQALGGVKIVAKDSKLVSVKVQGKPLDDNKIYTVATISFLLNGGDNIFVAKNAKSVDILKGYLYDDFIKLVKQSSKQHPISAKCDKRIQILSKDKMNLPL